MSQAKKLRRPRAVDSRAPAVTEASPQEALAEAARRLQASAPASPFARFVLPCEQCGHVYMVLATLTEEPLPERPGVYRQFMKCPECGAEKFVCYVSDEIKRLARSRKRLEYDRMDNRREPGRELHGRVAQRKIERLFRELNGDERPAS